MIRKNCVQDVVALLEMNERFMKKEQVALAVGRKVSTVRRALWSLRCNGKVVLYKNRWWGFKFADGREKL